MYRIGVLVVAAAAATGCHGGPGRGGRAALPADCLPAAGPKVEMQRCDEEVIRIPPRKVVVDLPPECPVPAPKCSTPGSNCQPPATGSPHAATGNPHAATGMPFAAQPAFGTPMAANIGLTASGAQVASARPSRTRFAFAPTTIRIPFPWLKMVPVEEPEEMTVRFASRSQAHAATGGAFSAFPMATMPMGTMPMGVTGFPMSAMPMGVSPAGGVAMSAMPQTQQAQFMCPPCPPCPPTISPERVAEFTRRIQELEAQLRANQPAAPAGPMAPTMN